MKRIALLSAPVAGVATVLYVCVWDGEAQWGPVQAGLCASIEDCTDNLAVAPGWTYADGVFGPPAPAPVAPDPGGFVAAVASSSGLSLPTRLAATANLDALALAVAAGNTALISSVWADAIAEYQIPVGDQSAVHALALAYGIPGI